MKPRVKRDWDNYQNFKICTVIAMTITCATIARGESFSIDSIGGRFGFSTEEKSSGFLLTEAFVNCNLPATFELHTNYLMHFRLDFGVGWLGRSGADAATTSAGPTLVLERRGVPLLLEMGASSTLITRYQFGDKNLGGPVQFTTHVGLSWQATRHWRVGYRFEHMSNAGLEHPNPGVHLHTFAGSYVF
jgi:hypothetical protein